MDLDVFETALTQVSAVLNHRPITHASSNIDDVQALSPANFIYPYVITPSSATILPPPPPDGDAMRASWRETRRLTEEFKRRWKEEYLVSLQPRTRWKKTEPCLHVGQLVLITDELTPRNEWRLARVIKILSTDKNHVRRVLVTTADRKTYERHVTSLVPLELEEEEEKTPLA